MSDNAITCWHKEIAEDGICKNCGARAAIKLQEMKELKLTPEQYSEIHEKYDELVELVLTSDGAKEDTSKFVAWAVARYGLRRGEAYRIVIKLD